MGRQMAEMRRCVFLSQGCRRNSVLRGERQFAYHCFMAHLEWMGSRAERCRGLFYEGIKTCEGIMTQGGLQCRFHTQLYWSKYKRSLVKNAGIFST